ncbi:suppressor of fused domain protein [Paenibacillus hunanensis]|uniref:suppressor of fused domain protein n=1 Tax=Paenibacillus hunanensis TaxID=539262 RepID=UPI002026AC46|nr:suppressor of fused domain protein [Paenibacillus hunanensis]MCL9662468.1 suppressor of fused domain protein [Paenibacillus hunanensis]
MVTAFNPEQQLAFDIRRSIILGAYIREWSMPAYRVLLNHPDRAIHVEIYYFPAADEDDIARFATVGLSNTFRSNGQSIGTEWMLALTAELGDESAERIFTYMCDLLVHHIEVAPDSRIPRVMGESELAPDHWSTRALLLDELRGESEELETIQVGDESIQMIWAVPLTTQEASLILQEGVEAFDSYIEESEYSIIDPCRE